MRDAARWLGGREENRFVNEQELRERFVAGPSGCGSSSIRIFSTTKTAGSRRSGVGLWSRLPTGGGVLVRFARFVSFRGVSFLFFFSAWRFLVVHRVQKKKRMATEIRRCPLFNLYLHVSSRGCSTGPTPASVASSNLMGAVCVWASDVLAWLQRWSWEMLEKRWKMKKKNPTFSGRSMLCVGMCYPDIGLCRMCRKGFWLGAN